MKSEFIINGITVTATVKDVRSMRLRVDRDGNAKLTIPRTFSESQILQFLREKEEWLERAVNAMKKRRETECSMIKHRFESGETFVFLGRFYKLKIDENSSATQVEERGDELIVHGQSSLSKSQVQRLLNAWFSNKFNALVHALLAKWMNIMKDAPLSEIRCRRMKSQWGSMQPARRILCLNTNLAFCPESCIEMIIVHELCHLKEASHNARFHALMAYYLPDYKERGQALREFFRNGLNC